ncbi:Crp/Fnr family transcriptional regulator [Brevundimonas sp.]|jgi:CRP-like cAMP-binding protein|uniref:Crp/Fnr family transcriptional regulator n=1 Tax=Brevundimonas sp. TaxID=1871086 RepID=UPI0037C149C4
MSRPNPARLLLSHLAVQGLDIVDAPVPPGARVQSHHARQPQVTLVLDGVVARLREGDPLSLGLAGPGELINFDAALGQEPAEEGLWLTRGRQVVLPAAGLVEALARPALAEVALADLRRRAETARIEVARHARGRVTERLAALLHDIQALSGQTELTLRQSDLADLLAVRRAGVSAACGELQAARAIRVRRGVIVLSDPEALGAAAGTLLTPP